MKISDANSLNLVLRSRIASGIILLIFFIISLRLWYLQILHGEYFQTRSENNRLREVYLNPPRGEIYARGGEVLVKNRPSFDIELVKEDCGASCDQTLYDLAKIIGKDPQQLKEVSSQPQRKRRRFEPRLILKDISREDVAHIAARKHTLKGIAINTVPARIYIYDDWASHVLGYIGEISQAQLESPNFSGYRQGDIVGKYGVERLQERLLQGRRGTKGIFVNASGTRLKDAYYEGEKPGHNVTLTIDYRTQQAMEEAMTGLKGAAVALDPQTGEILAMTSKPSFDPNLFVDGISAKVWAELNGPDKILNNRVVQGVYPLGSVFKAIVGVAGLSEGVVKPSEIIHCGGTFQVGKGRAFSCHGRHGAMDIKDALKKSCNVYFYTVGQRLGVDRIHDYATRFGFGKKTGLELVDEQVGLIPSTKWKKKMYKAPDNKWYPGETPSVSIGQGAIAVTPLQVARAMAALVNGGRVLKPYLVKEVELQDGTLHYEGKIVEQQTLGVEDWVLNTVRDALVSVVNEAGGTGGRAALKEFGIEVGGKTGTAQTKKMIGTKTLKNEDSLAWFSGFAPAQDPRIAVAVVVEGGGHGGVTSAPIAKKIMQAYLVRDLPAPANEQTFDVVKEKPVE